MGRRAWVFMAVGMLIAAVGLVVGWSLIREPKGAAPRGSNRIPEEPSAGTELVGDPIREQAESMSPKEAMSTFLAHGWMAMGRGKLVNQIDSIVRDNPEPFIDELATFLSSDDYRYLRSLNIKKLSWLVGWLVSLEIEQSQSLVREWYFFLQGLDDRVFVDVTDKDVVEVSPRRAAAAILSDYPCRDPAILDVVREELPRMQQRELLFSLKWVLTVNCGDHSVKDEMSRRVHEIDPSVRLVAEEYVRIYQDCEGDSLRSQQACALRDGL